MRKQKKKALTLDDMEDLTITDIAASIKDAAANSKKKKKEAAKKKAKDKAVKKAK